MQVSLQNRSAVEERRKTVVRYSLVSALFFAAFAAASYQSVYLMELGLTSSQIGVGTSIGNLTGLIMLPIWGFISDKVGSPKPLFLLCMVANALLFLVFPLYAAKTVVYVWPLYPYIAFTTVFRQPANSLLDSWIVGETTPKGIGYGNIRMWGSIGYAVVSLLLGLVIGKLMPTYSAFFFLAAFCVPLVAFCLKMPATAKTGKGEKKKVPLKLLFSNGRFYIYILYTIGLNIYLCVTLIYMGYILEHAGCDKTLIGVVTGVRALMEIISMRASNVLHRRWPIKWILCLSGLLFGAEQLLYAQCSGLISCLGVMVLSGLAGGIYYSMGPVYIHEIVDPAVKNTAQSISGMSMAATGIIGTLIGGKAIEAYGISTLTTACGCLILALTAIFGASLPVRSGKRGSGEKA